MSEQASGPNQVLFHAIFQKKERKGKKRKGFGKEKNLDQNE